MSEQNEKKNEKKNEETRPARDNKKGKRRGKYAYAAPVGLLVSILSIVGVVAIVMSLVGYIREKNDQAELKKELYYYLEPLLVYSPDPFGDAAKKSQDVFLKAATYKVSLDEQNRMLHEGAHSQYDREEDLGCYFVPEEVVEKAYRDMFGANAKLTHRSLRDSDITYSKTEKYYLVPMYMDPGQYEFVIDEVTVKKDRYEVRVGFVPKTDIKYDEHGNEMEPTAKQATHFQIYTLTRNKDKGTYYIKSCQDEKK